MKILLAESGNFDGEALAALEQVGELDCAEGLSRSQLLDRVADVDVLWTRLQFHIDGEVIDAARTLKFIATPTTGLNHIDLISAEHRGIRTLSLKGETSFLKEIRATAEHTLALTLALLRNIPSAVTHVHVGLWDRDAFRGQELVGKTVGIIGLGRLGTIVADLFHALGMQVLATDPNVHVAAEFVFLTTLDELLEKSDVVTMHASYSDEDAGFFGEDAFAKMKQGAWFINTSRGELVDERALLAALVQGHLAGAAVDVLSDEVSSISSAHPLIKYAYEHSNLMITPHIGGCTVESMAKTERFLAKKLLKALSED